MNRDMPPRGGRQSGFGAKGAGKGFGGRSREYSSWERSPPESGPGIQGRKIDPEDQGNLPNELIPVSRSLARLLRYGRDVQLDKDGWAAVSDVLSSYEMNGVSRQDLETVVKESFSKSIPRFEMNDLGGKFYIRAGHKRGVSYDEILHKAEWTPPSTRYDAFKDLQQDDGFETPPPPERAMREDPPFLDLDDRPAKPPQKAVAPSPASKENSWASDPWTGKGADPWSCTTQAQKAQKAPTTVQSSVQMRKQVVFADSEEVSQPSPSSPSFVNDLMNLDPVGIVPEVKDSRNSLLEVFIGDAEEQELDDSAAAATAAVYELQSLQADKTSEANSKTEEHQIGVSNVAGKVWEQFEHQDPSKGTWWWCEKSQEALLECDPGPWSQYEEPESKRPYWHNEKTEEFFYAK